MTGDGTNDAPALAQADVAVVMNSGTQAAKEAGNMVDLDSNPTKLIEIVEIGKQLLMTRGALTTFSIANDVAKYFAIIPAAFASTYPVLGALNVMGLATPHERDPVGGHLQRADHPGADSAGAARASSTARSARAAILRRNMLVYGVGGVLLPFVGIKADRHAAGRAEPRLIQGERSMFDSFLPALRMLVVLSRADRRRLSVSRHRASPSSRFPRAANGSLIDSDGKAVGSALHRPAVRRSRSTSGAGRRRRRRMPYNAGASSGSNQGARNPALADAVKDRIKALRDADPGNTAPVPVDLVTASASGLDPHISVAAAEYQLPRVAQGARHRRPTRCARSSPRTRAGRTFGILGEPRVNVLALNLALDRAAK